MKKVAQYNKKITWSILKVARKVARLQVTNFVSKSIKKVAQFATFRPIGQLWSRTYLNKTPRIKKYSLPIVSLLYFV